MPTQVGSNDDWMAVSTASDDAGPTFAIKRDGTLWAWGINNNGDLGLGDTTTGDIYYVPTQVGLDGDWTQVAASVNSAFALKSNGTLWAWGDNEDGNLGLGDTTDGDVHRCEEVLDLLRLQYIAVGRPCRRSRTSPRWASPECFLPCSLRLPCGKNKRVATTGRVTSS